MENTEQLELILRKKELLAEVYRLTKEATFVGDEDDAERYILLMESREKLFGEARQIDTRLPKGRLCTEAELVLSEIKKISGDILSLDKAIKADADRIMTGLKKSLKGISQTKNINNKYTGFISPDEGLYFDQKN